MSCSFSTEKKKEKKLKEYEQTLSRLTKLSERGGWGVRESDPLNLTSIRQFKEVFQSLGNEAEF